MNHLQVVMVGIVEVSVNIQNTLFQKLRNACNFFGYGTIECHVMGIIVVEKKIKVGIKPDGDYVIWKTSVELDGKASSAEIANSHVGGNIATGNITEKTMECEVLNIMSKISNIIDPEDVNSNTIRLDVAMLAHKSGWRECNISDVSSITIPKFMKRVVMMTTIPTSGDGVELLEVEVTFEKNSTNKTYRYWVKFNSCSPVQFVGTATNIHRHANDWLVSLKQSSAERFRVFNERYFVQE